MCHAMIFAVLWVFACQTLVNNRREFLTERSISQYFGLVRNNVNVILKEKYKNDPRERKMFYQVRGALFTISSQSMMSYHLKTVTVLILDRTRTDTCVLCLNLFRGL